LDPNSLPSQSQTTPQKLHEAVKKKKKGESNENKVPHIVVLGHDSTTLRRFASYNPGFFFAVPFFTLCRTPRHSKQPEQPQEQPNPSFRKVF
jgi:hypothetical protein